MTGVKQRAEG